MIKKIIKYLLPYGVVRLIQKYKSQSISNSPDKPKLPDKKNKHLCCEILYSHLTFEEDHLRPHCWRNSGDFLPKYPYKGEPLSRKRITDYLNHIAATLSSEPEKCEGCIRAYYDKKPQKVSVNNFKLKLIMLNQHRFWCNVKCSYCFWLARKKMGNIAKPYSIKEAIEFLFGNNMVDKDCRFSWGGGESTILPEFDSLARLICDKGHSQILNTNAAVYSDAWAYVLANDKQAYCNTSVDSGSAEVFKQIKNVDYFDQVWANIKKYNNAAINKYSFKVKYIVMASNRSHTEIEKFVDKCLDAGIRTVEYSVDGGEIAAGLSEETIAAVAYLRALVKKNNLGCENAVFWDPEVAKALDDYPLPEIL